MSGTFWSSGNLFFSHKNCSKNVRYRTPENICSSGEAVHHTLVDRIDDAAASLLPVIAHVGQERFLKHGRLAAGSDWHEGRRYASIPDPDPPIHMFLGLPDPDPISQRYGSRPFYHQAKIVRKNLIRTVLWLLLDFLPSKKDVNAPSKYNKHKNLQQDPDPNPDPLVRGMDPRIRIHSKMSWIRNTDAKTTWILNPHLEPLCFRIRNRRDPRCLSTPEMKFLNKIFCRGFWA